MNSAPRSRARLTGTQSPLLLPEVAQNVAAHLHHVDVLRFLACCHELQLVTLIELDLSSEQLPASRAIACARAYGQRFCLTFTVDRCDQVSLDQLLRLPSLHGLAVRPPNAGPTRPVRSLAACSNRLRQLRLLYSIAQEVSDVSPIARCPALTTLVMHCASSVEDLSPLGACRSLQTLDLRRCSRIRDLSGLAREGGAAAWQLSAVTLQGCSPLLDVSPLAALPRLRSLDLSLCSSLEEVSSLGRCSQLETLMLTGCTKLRDVRGLIDCPALRTLYVGGCIALSEVNVLAQCQALHTLHLNKCPNITDVSELGFCKTLRLLNLRCSGAVHVPCRDGLRVEFDK